MLLRMMVCRETGVLEKKESKCQSIRMQVRLIHTNGSD